MAVVAGPVVAGNGLTIYLYKADGTTVITSGTVDASGSCTLDVGSYTGVVIAKVEDTNAGNDYRDEATGQLHDLNANLMAVGVASSGTVSLNVNALTTLAALKAGANPTATTVAQCNAAVASAFHLTDLHGSITTTVNSDGTANASYTPASLSSSEKYGAVLAALSGVDAVNGGDMQVTINNLSAGLTVSSSTGTLNSTASDAIIQGAMMASATTSGSGALNLTAITSSLIAQTSASVSIDTVATDDIINASEKATATITGTNASGATVSLNFGGGNHAATVTGTTWSYALTNDDFTAMGQGGETITATATLAGVNSVATHSIVVDTVTPTTSSVAISSATGIQNSTLNTGDTVNVTVTMSEATFVTGTPQLALNIGGTTVQANYASGSGSTALVFSYAILDGQTDTDGISIAANSLNLNGGTLADAAGNPATLIHLAITDNAGYLVDTASPTATVAIGTVTDNVGAITGTLTTGGMTDDTSLVLVGTITGALDAGEVVAVYDGNTKLGNATISGSDWSYIDSTLANGDAVSYTVRVEDTAGNQGAAPTAFTTTIDTTVAAPSVPDLSSGSDSGSSNTDNFTNASTPTFTGTAEAGATVTLLQGETVFGTATADSGGAWSITSSTLGDGEYNIRAKQTDLAGNVSATSSALFVRIDKAAPNTPSITAVTDNVGTVQGTLSSGNTTDDTALALSGTNDTGATVNIYNGATLMGAATVTGMNWSYTATVADGVTYQFNAKATDVAGNTSEASTNSTVIGDTTAPTATAAIGTVTDNLGAITGALTTGGVTDDRSLALAGTITGALGAGDVVAVYDGTTKLGNATVSGSNWSYTDSTLDNGDHPSYTVCVEDTTGNKGTASAAFTVTISAPTATAAIGTVTDNAGAITGALTTGGVTDDTSLALAGTITGTLNVGEVVAVYDGMTKLGNATVSGSDWSYTDSTLASRDTVSYTVRVEDAAGNQGTASAAFTNTVDTPLVSSASFTEESNASISITFDEAVTALNTDGLTIYRYDALSGLVGPTIITPTGISGAGTTTLTITTSSSLGMDIVRLSYSASSGNITDMDGNALVSGEIFIGGSGVSNINLGSLNLDLTNPVLLFGNGGADPLTGTQTGDYIFDGEGADTIIGAQGADTIHLIENGTDKAYARDTIKIALGDSPADSITSVDLITGFDAKSATATDHDVLDLQSNTIAGNANINGTDVGLFATHSIASGIVSFKTTGGSGILVDMNNVNDAVAYLATNIDSSGATMAFEVDLDNSGVADSLVVFQDNGVALLDTVVVLDGVTGITLGTVIGANVVQII